MGKSGECAIHKRADGRWMAQTTIKLTDGRKKRVSVINKDRNIVKAKLAEIQSQQRKMIPFSAEKWTVGSYIDHWLKNIAPYKIRLSSMVSYESMTRIYIKPTIGKIKLDELGVRDVQRALDNLEQNNVPARTRQKYKQILSSCLSHAMREELIFRNVAMIAKMPMVHAKPIVPWSASQARYFLKQAKDDKYYIAYLMMITYGMRIGEMLGLRWSDIDFNNNIFVIRQQIVEIKGKLLVQTVKTDASRRQLPLIPAVRQALIEHALNKHIEPAKFNPERELTSNDLVITTSVGTPIEPHAFRKRNFYKLVDKSGLPRIKLHGLRHTAATILKDMGVPIKDVQEILGHTDIATTLKIYQHGNDIIKRNALTSVGYGLTKTPEKRLINSDAIRDSCSQNLLSNTVKPSKTKNLPLLKVDNSPLCPRAYESYALTN